MQPLDYQTPTQRDRRRRFWPTKRVGFRLAGYFVATFGDLYVVEIFELKGWAYWASGLVMVALIYLNNAVEKKLFGPAQFSQLHDSDD